MHQERLQNCTSSWLATEANDPNNVGCAPILFALEKQNFYNQAHCVQSSPHTNSSPTVYFIYLCDQLQWIAEVLCACSKDLVIFSRQILL